MRTCDVAPSRTARSAAGRHRIRSTLRALLPGLVLLAAGGQAAANTLTQNVSWTIDRAGTATKYRVVAYGDSIYAGYNGSITSAAKYAAPTVDAEYLSALWNADIESVRRAKSGAVASDIYNNKIVAERSYMQASSTRVVTFEMCGNDGLQARSSFKSQTGTCNYAGMNTAAEGFENLGGKSRSAVTLRVVPDPEKNRFYHVELADDPRGMRDDRVTVETTIDEAGNESTTTVRRSRFERDFVISAQAGWVLDDLAVRIGLFDSSGGVGADYRLSDRLLVTGEAFDFGGKRDDNPHVRLFGEYTLRKEKPHTPRLFITSGVDNPLNDTAFIIGGGVRWRDDDLKYLLGSIPLGK